MKSQEFNALEDAFALLRRKAAAFDWLEKHSSNSTPMFINNQFREDCRRVMLHPQYFEYVASLLDAIEQQKKEK